MKQIVLTLLLILTAGSAFAQFDKPSGGISIPRSNNPSVSPAPSATPSGYVSPFKINPPKNDKMPAVYQIGGDNNKDNSSVLEEKNEFVTGGSEYVDRTKVKPRGESSEAFKGNIDFGIIRTKSAYLTLRAYDFGAEDGDRVKITINDKVVVSDVMLSNFTKAIMLKLDEGFNDIRVEALNQGTSGPNTGGFGLFDNKDDNLKSSEWNLMTGFYGKFLVIKE